MKLKLFLILACFFVGHSFAANTDLELKEEVEATGPCDGYGGVVTIHITVNCDGDGDPDYKETVKTCADQAGDLIQMWDEFCD